MNIAGGGIDEIRLQGHPVGGGERLITGRLAGKRFSNPVIESGRETDGVLHPHGFRFAGGKRLDHILQERLRRLIQGTNGVCWKIKCQDRVARI